MTPTAQLSLTLAIIELAGCAIKPWGLDFSEIVVADRKAARGEHSGVV